MLTRRRWTRIATRVSSAVKKCKTATGVCHGMLGSECRSDSVVPDHRTSRACLKGEFVGASKLAASAKRIRRLRSRAARFGRWVVVLILASSISRAAIAQQSTSQPPDTPAEGTSSKSQTENTENREKEVRKKEQSQRMLGVVPQFAVTSRQDAPPLSTGDKFHLFAKSAFDPVEFGLVGFQAGLSQAENEFPEYGQGAEGYGKRYGAALADEVSAGFFSNFFYPAVLREDPRYFRLGQGTVKHRIGYALTQEFICHTDKGGRSFNFSNVLGAVSAGGLSNVYYPQSDRGFGLTLSRAGIALLYGSLGGMSDEFWPDISRKLFHKRDRASEPHGNQ